MLSSRFRFLSLLALMGLFASVYSSEKAYYCERITQPICTSSEVIHQYTRTPITVPTGPHPDDGVNIYQSQQDAVNGMFKYKRLLQGGRGCKKYLRPFLCSIYLPSCSLPAEPILPCRDLCELARSRCSWSMLRYGLSWARPLNCERFPTPEENPSCISALTFGEMVVGEPHPAPGVKVRCSYNLSPSVQPQWLMPDGTPVTEIRTQPIYAERTDKHTATLTIKGFRDSQHRGNYTCASDDQEFRRSITLDNIFEADTAFRIPCENITIPYCRDQLTYTHTALPNALGHTTQEEVEALLASKSCSPHIATVMCSYLLPRCDGVEPALPCRSIHDRVVTDCGGIFPFAEEFSSSCDCPACYNGIEIEPARFVKGMYGSVTMELLCRTKPSSLDAATFTIPSGQSYGLGQPLSGDDMYDLRVTREDERTIKLSTMGFSTYRDAGTYICSDGVFSKSTVVGDIPTVCVPITMPQCVGSLSYSHTQLPNTYGTLTQGEMGSENSRYTHLIRSGCSPFASRLLCGSFLARCDTPRLVDQPMACRELCELVEEDCGEILARIIPEGMHCDMFSYQAQDECYNGVEIGPVQVSETATGRRVEVDCQYTAIRPAKWLRPGSVEIDQNDHIEVKVLDSYSSRLIINDFLEGNDSGIYTCTDNTFNQTVDIYTKVIIPEVTIGHVMEEGSAYFTRKTVDCVYQWSPSHQPTWRAPNGMMIYNDSRQNVRTINVSDTVTRLVIGFHIHPITAGTYTCAGLHSSTTVDL